MTTEPASRDELAAEYLETLAFEPYPVQEEALLAYFTSDEGVLVCAPTGTGKTLIAEAAIYEALRTGTKSYYTTPLIALTDQKLQELQESAVRWGFKAEDIGLVTGNRRVNPDATVLVVVAEILLNRLMHPEAFDFSDVGSVVMDEFHSFNDRERGIVWEFSLGLLPKSVRLLLLSATVGNSVEFVSWLNRSHERRLELVQSHDRKVPLTFQWIPDMLLGEQIEGMVQGTDEARKTPCLIFCFNREECWTVGEQLKGKGMISKDKQKELAEELNHYDWSQGAGPKIRQLLLRGVGVHHAGMLPRYRRIVEEIFQRKLLSVTVCTETLAAGINLPARSVVIPNLLKGPPTKKKLLDPSGAHQMFGRAGRPQFDSQGYVFALAHEDDVKILRWRQKYDQIPEDTKDPQLRKAKKALKKKMPTRRSTQQYWNEQQFDKLRTAEPANLASRGSIPWRLLAHMLKASPDVDLLRQLVGKRLMEPKRLDRERKTLTKMLVTLWKSGYVELEPEPKALFGESEQTPQQQVNQESEPKPDESAAGLLSQLQLGRAAPVEKKSKVSVGQTPVAEKKAEEEQEEYLPKFARPTEQLEKLLSLRSVNPLFGIFAVNHLAIADRNERIQIFESMLEMPGSVARYVRVPSHEELPPGPLATTRLDVHLLQLGLVTPEQLGAGEDSEEEEDRGRWGEDERVFVLSLAEKLRMLFDHDFPDVHDVRLTPVWAVGELLEFGGNFNKYITSKGLQKQEGILFRHLLRLILLLDEFAQLAPAEVDPEEWEDQLFDLSDELADICQEVDPSSTEKTLEEIKRQREELEDA